MNGDGIGLFLDAGVVHANRHDRYDWYLGRWLFEECLVWDHEVVDLTWLTHDDRRTPSLVRRTASSGSDLPGYLYAQRS